MSTARNINSAKPFRRSAEAYRVRGWLGTLPLPPRSKEKPPTGFTGRAAEYPSDDDIASWMRMPKYAQGNICLHLGPVETDVPDDNQMEIIGIDVDDYMDGGKRKEGGKQLAALEAELGKLPPTYISSSRTGVSGIRFYRVPAGYAWAGKAAPHIDIIQKCHRYAIVFPSWHPGETDAAGNVTREGGQYKWRNKSGQVIENLEDLPDVSELPVLPDAWLERLTRGGMRDEGNGEIDMDLSVDEMFRWAVGALPGSDEDAKMCKTMRKIVNKWKEYIQADASTHDKIVGAHWNIVCLASEGHAGWRKALSVIDNFVAKDTIQERGKREIIELRNEIMRSKVNALRKIKAQIDSGNRGITSVCVCYDPSPDEEAVNAFTAKVKQHRASDDDYEEDLSETEAAKPFNEASLGERDGYWPSGIPDGDVKDPADYEQNDRGNGEHWADMHANSAFYVPALSQWMMWTGRNWIIGDGCAERSFERVERRQQRYAKQLLRRAADLAAQQDDSAKSAVAEARSWRAWAQRSGNVGPIESALKSAQSRLSIEESELNANESLIGCRNGVLELDQSPLDDRTSAGQRNGLDVDEDDYESVIPSSARDHGGKVHAKFRNVRKEDLLTLSTGTDYLPWNELINGEFGKQEQLYARIWQESVELYLPDDELRHYAQKLLGYSLLGDNRERIVVFLHGPTGSGKSTFLYAVQKALGDYATDIDLNIFKSDRQTNPALAAALPKRIVMASEANDRTALHADMFKRITGGDPITAELKYSNEAVKRVPAFTPWIATNTPPRIPGADAAVNDRTKVIGFTEQISSKDAGMNNFLSNKARTAVFSWAVEGWGFYRREKLKPENDPISVQNYTREFVKHYSDTSEFLAEVVERAPERLLRKAKRLHWGPREWPEEWCPSRKVLYEAYKTWCSENGIAERAVLSQNALARKLTDYGFQTERIRVNGVLVRFYPGLKVNMPEAHIFQLHQNDPKK